MIRYRRAQDRIFPVASNYLRHLRRDANLPSSVRSRELRVNAIGLLADRAQPAMAET
jgi:hypothetical protein